MIYSPPHLLDGARWKGVRVGILGGSFNPPHTGHRHISEIALHTLQLDVIWWLVSPQNPLKDPDELEDFDERFDQCLEMADHPRMVVSDLERVLEVNQTYQTIDALRYHFPLTEFVWITGMDNAMTMHHWHNWRMILDSVATAHIARPPAWDLIENCPLKMLHDQNHVFLHRSQKVPLIPHNTYWIMQKKMLEISSTKIRNTLK